MVSERFLSLTLRVMNLYNPGILDGISPHYPLSKHRHDTSLHPAMRLEQDILLIGPGKEAEQCDEGNVCVY